MDGTSRPIEVDSASTAQEVVAQISSNLGIVDTFGFSIYVKVFDKVLGPRIYSFYNKKISFYAIEFNSGDVNWQRQGTYYGRHIEL